MAMGCKCMQMAALIWPWCFWRGMFPAAPPHLGAGSVRTQDIKAVGKDKAHEGTFDLTAYVEFQRNFRCAGWRCPCVKCKSCSNPARCTVQCLLAATSAACPQRGTQPLNLALPGSLLCVTRTPAPCPHRMLARSHRAALIAQRKFWMHLL